jgi:hypothetical protein
VSIDTSRVGELVAEQMQAIEEDFTDEAVEIVDAVIVTEVRSPDGLCRTRVRCTSPSAPVMVGLLHLAIRASMNPTAERN